LSRWTFVLLALALGTCALGLSKASYVASASDAYGYVSEADLIAHGSLRVEQQFVRTLPWPFADWSFAPPGYRPAPERGFIVPTYPAGVPLLMSLFQRVAGKDAVFYLVPLLGGFCVWMTGVLGSWVHGRLSGQMAALLLATSPSFMTELMAPASDVAATAWWTTAIALTVKGGSWAALGAGAAVSLAVLTRPNLVPLAMVVGLFWIGRALRNRRNGRPEALPLALFVGAAVPGCLAVAAINQHLYGSPWSSGYQPLGTLYALANAGPNLDRYPRWLMQTQTPFICLALMAPLFGRARGEVRHSRPLAAGHVRLLLSFAAVVLLSYLFYIPFGREEWTYLRFLLPAYPPLLVLAVAVAVEIVNLATARESVRVAAVLILCVGLAGWQARLSVARGALDARLIERRYVDVGRYIDVTLPSNSVVIAGVEAGSIRYYSGRLTMSFERLQPRWLDDAVGVLRERGLHPFIALEEAEEKAFRERFAEMNAFGRLDWPPVAERREPIRVRIYDPADRERFQRDSRILTQTIGRARGW
jgi:hypothetical protein